MNSCLHKHTVSNMLLFCPQFKPFSHTALSSQLLLRTQRRKKNPALCRACMLPIHSCITNIRGKVVSKRLGFQQTRNFNISMKAQIEKRCLPAKDKASMSEVASIVEACCILRDFAPWRGLCSFADMLSWKRCLFSQVDHSNALMQHLSTEECLCLQPETYQHDKIKKP